MALATQKRKRGEFAKRFAYIDFDGSKLCVGKQYKSYKAQEKLFSDARKGNCPHPAVMLTVRCQLCGLNEVHIVHEYPVEGGTIQLELPIAHNHII